jgi:hypothetical protein
VAVLDPDPRPGFLGWKVGTAILGGVIMFASIYFWSLEGNEGYQLHLDDEKGHDHDAPSAKH